MFKVEIKSRCSGSICMVKNLFKNRRGVEKWMIIIAAVIGFFIILGFYLWLYGPLPDLVDKAISYIAP